jgi:hypothetical protein
MSGNKGMGNGGRWSGESSGTGCKDINFETNLFSPDPTILILIKQGDVLAIEYTSPKGPLLVVYIGKIAGTIITKLSTQLIVCMENGIKFIAVVKSINGGSCTVQIKSK